MNKITKSQINAVLKEHGLANVKLSCGDFGHTSKVYKDQNGKMVKGIKAACHGPMTVTDAHVHHVNERYRVVEIALLALGMWIDKDENFATRNDTGKQIVMSLETTWLPAYARSADLDPGYKNIYLVPVFS